MAITEQEVFETGTDAFNAHDLEGIAERLADDVVFSVPGEVAGEGKAACVEFYGRWLEEFPDAKLHVQRVQVVDDVAVEEGTFTGKPIGAARTGRSVSLDFVQVVRFSEGKHVWLNLSFDRLLMLEQLGLISDATAADAVPAS
jgi:uncharacterized protein (TIGR02246 family)